MTNKIKTIYNAINIILACAVIWATSFSILFFFNILNNNKKLKKKFKEHGIIIDDENEKMNFNDIFENIKKVFNRNKEHSIFQIALKEVAIAEEYLSSQIGYEKNLCVRIIIQLILFLVSPTFILFSLLKFIIRYRENIVSIGLFIFGFISKYRFLLIIILITIAIILVIYQNKKKIETDQKNEAEAYND